MEEPRFLQFAMVVLVWLFISIDNVRGNGMHNIHWNSSNPLFNDEGNIIQVNGGNHPWEYDQVNIVCPFYKSGIRGSIGNHNQERYVVYSVSKTEYDSCRITQPNPRIIAVCDRPYELMYFTITFRSFTPTPGGLEFRPGQSYYFISTSSKNDIHRRVGGGCSTHNMKITFKVADEKPTPRLGTTPKLILETDNHLFDGGDDVNPKKLHQFKIGSKRAKENKFYQATPSAAASAPTLYYPFHEMSQIRMRKFQRHKTPAAPSWFPMLGDDPRIANSSSSSPAAALYHSIAARPFQLILFCWLIPGYLVRYLF